MTPGFQGQLAAAWVIGKRPSDDREQVLVELRRELVYRSRGGRVYTIPKGFLSDLNSTPWWARSIFALARAGWAETARVGFLHDYAYAHGGALKITRREADRLHYEAMRLEGFGRSTAWAMWLGLRAGGWRSWNRYRAAEG